VHYQEPGFVEPITSEERTERFWGDLERRYHYCPECRRYTEECELARRRPCTTEHSDVALDDSDFVAIAWIASRVDAPLPVQTI
jgi:hypothetical protein